MKIFLCRHGESTGDIEDRYGGSYDDHLTKNGQDQSKQLAEKLKLEGVEKIFHSPLFRARETAQIVAEALDCTTEVNDDVRERDSYGVMTGMIKSEAAVEFPVEAEKYLKDKIHHSVKGSESYEELKERITKAYEYILASGHAVVVIVSHGQAMGCLLREVIGKEFTRFGDCGYVILEDKTLVSIHPT
jgi:broad specificity phosphatase PhoE